MDSNEIRVKVNGGYLVAGRNADPNNEGIYVVFETDNGDVIDIVVAECSEADEYKKINVYSFEDVYTEDFTRKHTLDIAEIYKALGAEE